MKYIVLLQNSQKQNFFVYESMNHIFMPENLRMLKSTLMNVKEKPDRTA